MALAAGTKLGPYEILGPIGAGGMGALNHPNICTLYDVGPNYLVMEYIEGQSISAWRGRPSPRDLPTPRR